jgi:flagellar L-ring protein precursor FlgH
MNFKHIILLGTFSLGGMAGATSLYQPVTFQPYTSDLRLRHVGDLITVMVYESASATTTANTSSGRDAAVGWQANLPGKSYAGGLKTSNQLDGGGHTTREGRVLAQITVAVREITESGDLVVLGEQLLDINDERQQIRVEGRLRPQDVSDANVVQSTRIANAKISYIGQGDLANSQRPAWWQRFLTLFGI